MKILLLTGDHQRHIFFANAIKEKFSNTFHFIQKREEEVPNPPEDIMRDLKKLWTHHFNERKITEEKWFHTSSDYSFESLVTPDDLKEDKSFEIFSSIYPDLVLVYGTGLIGTKLSNLGKIGSFNFHGGLSPWYRGSATHFWPSYFLEPQFTGVTIHSLAKKIDAGNIIHQSTPKLDPSDSLHDLSCRAVMTALNELIQILENIDLNQNFKSIVQKTSGKLF